MAKNVIEDREGNFIELPCVTNAELRAQVEKTLNGHMVLLAVDAVVPDSEIRRIEQEGEA